MIKSTTNATEAKMVETKKSLETRSNANEENEKQNAIKISPEANSKTNTKQEMKHSLKMDKCKNSTQIKSNIETEVKITQNDQAKVLIKNLIAAASEGKVDLCRLLLRCNVNLNGQDEEVSCNIHANWVFKLLIICLVVSL